jgi:hypothetical protein
MSLPRDQRGISRLNFGSQTSGIPGGHQRLVKSSTNDGHCYYLKPGFFENPTNQFWENRNDMTEAGKEYFRECLNAK